jgi:hypothetical protein
MTIRCHVFTNADEIHFLKQVPNFDHECDGVLFSYGLDIPTDIDVLLVYTRASYSIPTNLPKERTIFFAGEPDVIHPFSVSFLNQFGLVLTTSPKVLETHKIQDNYCSLPFVGIDFNDRDNPLNLEHFAQLECPPKDDRISVVTSTKAYTEFQKKRLDFLKELKARIPEKLVLYGRGFKSIDDKKDALLGHKYHLALENGGAPFTWTEKLSDPLLCYALPFYHGCENYSENLPENAAVPIKLDSVDEVINMMIAAQKDKLWEQRRPDIDAARNLILTELNLVKRFASLAKIAFDKRISSPKPYQTRLIRSERSLWPEKDSRGSVLEHLIRAALIKIWPTAELSIANRHKNREIKRLAVRKARAQREEKQNS